MQQAGGAPDAERELAELRSRRDALRHSAGLPGAQPLQVMSAAMAELDAAIARANRGKKVEAPAEEDSTAEGSDSAATGD